MTRERSRGIYLMSVGLAILAGLLWRSRLLPLSPFFSKYGGDALWAVVVFFGFGFLLPGSPLLKLALLSLGSAWGIEFLQLYHAPWIDSVRGYRLGHLILGTTFNAPDLIAYAVGVTLAAFLEALLHRVFRRNESLFGLTVQSRA